MLNKLCLSKEWNNTIITFFKWKLASKSNEVTCYASVEFVFPFVEFCTFNQPMKTWSPLSVRLISPWMIVGLFTVVNLYTCLVLSLSSACQLKVHSAFLICLVSEDVSKVIKVKNFPRNRVFYWISQLINLKVKFYIISFCHQANLRKIGLLPHDFFML